MFALDDKYPIDTKDQIKEAADYFDKYIDRLSPVNRSRAAYRLEKQAEALECPLDHAWIKNYSRAFKKTAGYSPSFKKNMELRKIACKNNNININIAGKNVPAVDVIDKMVKNAMSGNIIPLVAVTTINEFDKMANLQVSYDKLIKDPLFTVYGDDIDPEYDREKVAENISINNYDLKRIPRSEEKMAKISSLFGENVKVAFSKNPVQTFKDMGVVEQSLFSEQIHG